MQKKSSKTGFRSFIGLDGCFTERDIIVGNCVVQLTKMQLMDKNN